MPTAEKSKVMTCQHGLTRVQQGKYSFGPSNNFKFKFSYELLLFIGSNS